MIIEVLIFFIALALSFVLWHLWYTQYKEREWKRNNPDEFDLLDRPKKRKNNLME